MLVTAILYAVASRAATEHLDTLQLAHRTVTWDDRAFVRSLAGAS